MERQRDGGFLQDQDGTFELVLDQGRDPASLDDGIYLGKGLEAYDLAIRLDDPRFDDDYPGCSVNITYHVDSFLSPSLAPIFPTKAQPLGRHAWEWMPFKAGTMAFLLLGRECPEPVVLCEKAAVLRGI